MGLTTFTIGSFRGDWLPLTAGTMMIVLNGIAINAKLYKGL